MTTCKTCNSANTCSSCINNMVLSNTSCICSSGQLLDPISLYCKNCYMFFANCQYCDYSPSGLNSSSPTSVVCTLAAIGYYLESNGSVSACEDFCEYCIDSATCTSC